MQDTQLLNEGLALMGVGMGFVFVFLTVLVIVTTLMSKVIGRFFPEPVAPPVPARGRGGAPASQDDYVMVAISAAVHRYRRRHRR
ncbi:OadG family protein [Halomonas daqiaonensis]|uniref:Probable oxaloacetate decarboxylase gamma chain n=1 Tax=Halomonas daqiaonensis TaxID=650850 RepID=A0A1H7PBY8_9GAMM|nr:OadG family transporter subunit [Halomonas daqiaonensis]SEL33146.1 oxaloacetate decarboxylase, gamma subunit [Halomonas daqiaonensis]